MVCEFEVDTGVGRVNAIAGATDFEHEPYVDEYPYGWVETDPPPAHTYVEDLFHDEIGAFPSIEFHVTETLSTGNPPIFMEMGGHNHISLDDPTQLGQDGRRLARWRLRVSDILTGHALDTTTYEYRLFPYTIRTLTDHWYYILTAANLAEGWTYPTPEVIDEFWYVGGMVSDGVGGGSVGDGIGWRLTFQGDGDVTLGITLDSVLLAETAPFAFTTDWYTVELLAEGTDASAKVWADGDTEPVDYQVTDTVPEVTGLPTRFTVEGEALLFRDTPDLWVEWDRAEIWGP